MKRKEMRKAVKGCGFKGVVREAKQFIKFVNNFRKVRNPADVEQRAKDLEVIVENLRTSTLAAVSIFQTHQTTPVDAEEAYVDLTDMKHKGKKAKTTKA